MFPPVAPPPVREPSWVLKPVMSKVAPPTLARVIAELFPNAPLTLATEATPALSVPAFTVVSPEKVFAPESVRMPEPILVSPPVPDTMPA